MFDLADFDADQDFPTTGSTFRLWYRETARGIEPVKVLDQDGQDHSAAVLARGEVWENLEDLGADIGAAANALAYTVEEIAMNPTLAAQAPPSRR